jgi:hypothetical protein
MRIKTYTIASILITGCIIAGLNSCKNDAIPTPAEYVSTMKVVAQNLSTLRTDTFEYVNFNETRPNPPSYVDTIRLSAKSSYSIRIILLDETATPVKYLTDTITARAVDHLMVYNVDPAPGLISVQIKDKDSKGLPLGLLSNWATSDSTNGWLRLILRQQQGHKNGTETPGSTVFEADYPVTVR